MHTLQPPRPLYDASSPLLVPEAAAAYLQVHHRTLANWRVLGRGPRYVRVGRRPFYRRSDLDAWLNERVYDHTAAEHACVRERR